MNVKKLFIAIVLVGGSEVVLAAVDHDPANNSAVNENVQNLEEEFGCQKEVMPLDVDSLGSVNVPVLVAINKRGENFIKNSSGVTSTVFNRFPRHLLPGPQPNNPFQGED